MVACRSGLHFPVTSRDLRCGFDAPISNGISGHGDRCSGRMLDATYQTNPEAMEGSLLKPGFAEVRLGVAHRRLPVRHGRSLLRGGPSPFCSRVNRPGRLGNRSRDGRSEKVPG